MEQDVECDVFTESLMTQGEQEIGFLTAYLFIKFLLWQLISGMLHITQVRLLIKSSVEVLGSS